MDRDTTFRWVCIILNSIRNSPLLKTLKCDYTKMFIYNCSCCCHINVILQSRSNLNWLSHARTDIVPKNLQILDFTSQGSFTELAPSSFRWWSGFVRCHWVQKLAATVFLNFVSGNWLSRSKQDNTGSSELIEMRQSRTLFQCRSANAITTQQFIFLPNLCILCLFCPKQHS